MFSQLNTFLYFALIKRQLELSTAKKLSQSCFKLIVNEPRVGHLPYSWILHQFGSFSVPTPRNLASKIEKCANARVFIQGVRDGHNLN